MVSCAAIGNRRACRLPIGTQLAKLPHKRGTVRLRAEAKRVSRRNFLMAGGGTGGHVVPALAVARELRQRGHEVFFVGTDRGLEARLVPAEGFELKRIDIGGLNRVSLRQKVATLFRLP